jgi:hypothetical protein
VAATFVPFDERHETSTSPATVPEGFGILIDDVAVVFTVVLVPWRVTDAGLFTVM